MNKKNLKFSKIGTNPMKYFNNYLEHINGFSKGSILYVKDLKVIHDDLDIFSANSDATFRQNIDAWVWMHFLIRKNKNELIKIIDIWSEHELIEYIKYSLFIKDKNEQVNIHRQTILAKLITLSNEQKESCLINYSYDEIKKECGEFEKVLLSDKNYIEFVRKIWSIY